MPMVPPKIRAQLPLWVDEPSNDHHHCFILSILRCFRSERETKWLVLVFENIRDAYIGVTVVWKQCINATWAAMCGGRDSNLHPFHLKVHTDHANQLVSKEMMETPLTNHSWRTWWKHILVTFLMVLGNIEYTLALLFIIENISNNKWEHNTLL